MISSPGLEETIAAADEFPMSRPMSFQEILEEKMRGTEARETHPTDVPGATDPAHLAFLLGKTGVFRFRPPRRPESPRSARPAQQGPVPSARRTPGPPHKLSDRQKAAALWFERFRETLPCDYTAAELKGAFRRLARRLHPDHSGTGSEAFLELKSHYEALNGVFADREAV